MVMTRRFIRILTRNLLHPLSEDRHGCFISAAQNGLKRKKRITQTPDQCLRDSLAPQVGLEPTTTRLTAECSAIELLRNIGHGKVPSYFPASFLNPATSYSPGPFPAKYHQRAEA